MKHNILTLATFFLFVVGFFIIYGTAGASDLEKITAGQAIWRYCIGLVPLVADIPLINYLDRKEGKT